MFLNENARIVGKISRNYFLKLEIYFKMRLTYLLTYSMVQDII